MSSEQANAAVDQNIVESKALNYAVILTGGKQYRVSAGARITVEKLLGSVGDKVSFGDVLMVRSEDKILVGAPIVQGASVQAKIVAHGRGPKLLTFKKRRRKGYQKKQGHRQAETTVVIESIG